MGQFRRSRIHRICEHWNNGATFLRQKHLHFGILLPALIAVEFGTGRQQQLLETGVFPMGIVPRHTALISC